MKRLRVALLRGPYLGPFEAQNYEPLLDRFDLHAYILPQNRFALDDCRLPITVCRYPDAWLFAGRSLLNSWRTRVLGERYPMPGVRGIVRKSDVVHTFEGWYSYTRQAARACRQYHVPLVVTHWDTIPYQGKLDPNLRREIAETYRIAARILATSDAARDALLKDGIAENKIEIQPMGVDVDRFSPGDADQELKERLGIHSDDFVFLFIGRFVAEKGIRQLAGAFRSLCQQSSAARVKLLLVGSGPEEAWLRSCTESWELEQKILIAAPVPYSQLHRWYRLGNAFVYPSVPFNEVQEQFGYALVEAMSAGRAIVTTVNGGIPYVVGNAAKLVSPGDEGQLCEAMAFLWRNAAERHELGTLARRRAVNLFSTRVVSESLSRVYREVCSF
ncbi:MAG TPA: glycosyltransferase family 4 protein [Acidobacteriota bacterium]|jgi:glycosyltransferase involved in cell wall biosynthesis|nr:glycosyltransferase family 4 protein [Acidobacteriota bacterium]